MIDIADCVLDKSYKVVIVLSNAGILGVAAYRLIECSATAISALEFDSWTHDGASDVREALAAAIDVAADMARA